MINALETPKIQNSEESNTIVNNVFSSRNAHLNVTRISCPNNDSYSITNISLSATPSCSNCDTTNDQISGKNHVTDHVLHIDVFEPCKPSKACLLTTDSMKSQRSLDEPQTLEIDV